MINHLKAYHTIAFIGLSKNAGKTTTLNAVLAKDYAGIGLTSIGLDGEAFDQITALPKPSITVYEGMIVATAKACLKDTTIDYDIIEVRKDMPTSLGDIVIIRILSKGTLVVAGPVSNAQLKTLILTLRPLTKKLYIDGALSRKTFTALACVDAIVLASGAAFSPSMKETIEETLSLILQFNLPAYSGNTFTAKPLVGISNHVVHENSKEPNALNTLLAHGPFNYLYVHNALTSKLVEAFIKYRHILKNTTLVINDPTKLLINKKQYTYLTQVFKNIEVLNPLTIACVTVNPFRPVGLSYDKELFLSEIKKRVSIPVMNVTDWK